MFVCGQLTVLDVTEHNAVSLKYGNVKDKVLRNASDGCRLRLSHTVSATISGKIMQKREGTSPI